MTDRAALKAEVEAAVEAELQRVGPEGFSPATIWNAVKDRGPGRSTVYRWIDAAIASGKPGQKLAAGIRAATAARQAEPDPAAAAGRAAAARLPVPVRPQDIAGGESAIAVIQQLQGCIKVAEQVIAHARHEDGRVKNSKLLLAASEHMRRNLETAVRLQEAVRQVNQVEQFHGQIIAAVEKVARKHPQAAEEIIAELGILAAQWS